MPGEHEGRTFLACCERIFEHYRPDILLTYGGHWLAHAVIHAARRRGIRVVFALHNFAYEKAGELFRKVDAVLVPSRFAQAHYKRILGLESTAIPGPWNWDRLLCNEFDRRFVTFVNPQPHKGVFVFARIATELARLRPDIPMLVVEGRAKAGWLERTGNDLSIVRNMQMLENTPDPRGILSREPGRPDAEPVVGILSTRGRRITHERHSRFGFQPRRHPGSIGTGRFLFDIPAQYTPESRWCRARRRGRRFGWKPSLNYGTMRIFTLKKVRGAVAQLSSCGRTPLHVVLRVFSCHLPTVALNRHFFPAQSLASFLTLSAFFDGNA